MKTSGKKILLVEPNFPISNKSKNYSNFLPIGLLKLASFQRSLGNQVFLIKGNATIEIYPDEIFITSLFTYWADYVRLTVNYYKYKFPKAKTIVGGIYATLMPDHCKKFTGCDEVFIGIHEEAENFKPAYDLVDVDYQIIHGMRGCTRTCNFCGIWRLEKKKFKNCTQILSEIEKNKIIFFDNNFLANSNIEDILNGLANFKLDDRVVECDAQSGIDGRILEAKPQIAKLLKRARFSTVRVAWDFDYDQYDRVKDWINILRDAGYTERNIFVFMIYNWDYDFDHMEMKRQKCFEWNIQIADCRFRPLTSTFDHYDGNKANQTVQDYFIHQNWTDIEVKQFRKNVRQHNICIRYKIPWNNYSRQLERINARNKIQKIGA